MAQLAINRLPLPSELLIIVKDFTWLTKERKKIMGFKVKTHMLILLAFSPENPYGVPAGHSNNAWWFCAEYIQFQAFFCKKCGEYYYYEFKSNAICKCI